MITHPNRMYILGSNGSPLGTAPPTLMGKFAAEDSGSHTEVPQDFHAGLWRERYLAGPVPCREQPLALAYFEIPGS